MQKTQQREEQMKKKLEEALHEVRLNKHFLCIRLSCCQVDTQKHLFSLCFFCIIAFQPQCHAQQKVIGELALSRQAYEEILSAKNKELEVTKVFYAII